MAGRGDDVRQGSRWSWRKAIASVVLLVGVAASAVVPVLLCERGWREAEVLRGHGAGSGVFTAASCGDRKETANPGGDGPSTITYTCHGAFTGSSTPPVSAEVSSDSDHRAGWKALAYTTGAGVVGLADNGEAAGIMAVWATAASVVACVEIAAVWGVSHWIRSAPFDKKTRVVVETGGLNVAVVAIIVLIMAFFLLWGIWMLLFWLFAIVYV